MIKITMIGAGSVVFSKNLTGDILSYPEFRDATISYMDVDAERLEVGANLCRKVAKALGANPKIEATLDRRKALEGADFVINMVQIGGFDSTLVDFEIPRKYGLNFTIADTTGPGGIFRALRTFPMLRDMCRDMEEVCPRAVLLNYANPMCMNMQTITRTSDVRAVGLCHSVQGTFGELMRYLGEKPEDVAFICAGINHMAFYLRLEKEGVDLYPRLFDAMKTPKIYESNKVRFELMKMLGYFITESSEHNAEYNAHFIPHGREVIERYSIPIDDYLRRCDGIVDDFERMKKVSVSDEAIEVKRSHEYGSAIIHSMVTGTPRVVYGNMPNRGAISNLPDDAIVEVPTLVDRTGLQFTTVGALPPQLTAYMQPHIAQQELFIRAATEGRRDHLYQAAMFDPLTAATLTLDQIVEMCDELIAAHGDLLPALDAPTLVPTSGKNFGPVNAAELRASWQATEEKSAADFVKEWHVIGPFFSTNENVSLALPTPVEASPSANGMIDLQATHSSGDKTLSWKPVTVPATKGHVVLGKFIGPGEHAVAYAYTEVDSIHARDAVLQSGSSDGMKVWLNGRVVHEIDVERPYSPHADSIPVHLEEGVNRLLLKIVNHTGGSGFSLTVPSANF